MKLFELLFPAYAGVILFSLIAVLRIATFPRLRGGDPSGPSCQPDTKPFSPPTRG